jgi:hypothetical protein
MYLVEPIRSLRAAVRVASLAFPAVVLFLAPATQAEVPPLEEATLIASDGGANDHFGKVVAVSGEVAVVGSTDDELGVSAGAAYIYRYDGTDWVEDTKLTASNGGPTDFFGDAVAVSGHVVLVGAWSTDEYPYDAGSAYVYRYDGSGWNEEVELVPSLHNAYDCFGRAVAVSGDVGVVGSPCKELYRDCSPGPCVGGVSAGMAFIFRYTGNSWVEDAALLDLDLAAHDGFGAAVAVSGDVAVVGVPGDDDQAEDAGSAFVYRYNGSTWAEEARLRASDGVAEDRLGDSIAVWGDIVVIGVERRDPGGLFAAGSAYVFRYDGTGWEEEAKLTASNPQAYDRFGASVAVSGGLVLVGGNHDKIWLYRHAGSGWVEQAQIPGEDPGGSFGEATALSGDVLLRGEKFADNANGASAGEARVFRLTRPGGKRLASDGAAFDYFGSSTALSGDMAVVGAPFDDNVRGNAAGGAYLYHFDGTQWSEDMKLTDPLGASGDHFGHAVAASGGIVAVGFPSVANDRGGVEIFRRDGATWALDADLCCGATGSQRGYAVAASGDIVAWGEPEYEAGGMARGQLRLHRYTGSGWGTGISITASDGADGDRLGSSVAVAGDVLVAGAPYVGTNAGAAYIFRWDGTGWSEEVKLTALFPAIGDDFGRSVAAFGDVVVVGAPFHDPTAGADAGIAWVYRYDGTSWIFEDFLIADDGAASHHFGTAVAVFGDRIVVGAPEADDGEGALYAFHFDPATGKWEQEIKLTPPDAGLGLDRFGAALALWGDVALGGAPEDDVFFPTQQSERGSVSFFAVKPLPEPSSVVGLGCGILAMVGLARMRRRRTCSDGGLRRPRRVRA